MNLAPFTKEEALLKSIEFKNLTWKDIIVEGVVRKILFVGFVPFGDAEKLRLSEIFFRCVNKLEGYKMSMVDDYINNYKGNDFDVVIIHGHKHDDGVSIQMLPLQLISKGDALEIGFNIEIQS